MPTIIKNKRPIATLEVQFNCGCGFKTVSPDEAQKHSVESRHTITICGYIEPIELEREAQRRIYVGKK